MNKKRFLITSSDESLWKFNEPVIFLGEWCKLYDRKNIWDKLDYIVAEPYGNSKKDKIDDFRNTTQIEQILSIEFFSILNKIHSVKYSNRFWNILLGHWIRRFIRTVYNRIKTFEKCLLTHEISGVSFYDFNKVKLANRTTSQDLYFDEKWNSALDHRISLYFLINSSTLDPVINNIKVDKIKENLSFNKIIFKQLIRFLNLFFINSDAFIISSKLSKVNDILLNLKLRQIPKFWRSPEYKLVNNYDRNFRLKISKDHDKLFNDKYVQIIFDLFFDCLPICYLEDFINLNKQVDTLPWPNKPKFIFTSNNFDTDELFKLWTAKKVELGIKYIVGQHGGGYGTYKYSNPTIEEITSDKFLTWGWKDGNYNHVPFYNYRVNLRNYKLYNPNGSLLLIEIGLDFRINTWDSYTDFNNYIQTQFKFARGLSNRILQNLLVRLKAENILFNVSDSDLWRDFNQNIKIDNGSTPIFNLIKNSRLIIHSYDSTGFLETLSLNIPTMLFLHNELDDLRESAIPYYELLIEVGILHIDAISLSEKINFIWNDIDKWWNNTRLQEVRNIFCQNFSRKPDNIIFQFKKELLN